MSAPRAVLALGALCWLACGGTPAAPEAAPPATVSVGVERTDRTEQPPPTLPGPRGREANAAELQMVRELSREAERIRGLRFLRPVKVRVQDAAEMKHFVEDQIDEEELEIARQRYVMLELLEPTLEVRPLLLDLMEEQLVGYYDPDQGLLAIRNDVADSLRDGADPQQELTLRAVLLHELIHALQDQHFDLKTRLDEERTTDADAAVTAVVEGDATLAMIAYAVEDAGLGLEALLANPALLGRMLGSGMATSGDRLEKAPTIVREPLLFPYREGAAFVAELVRRGGWAAVDAVHQVPPPSGGHVLWPERELGHVVPPSLDSRLPEALAGDGIELVEEDELGPYEIGLFLEELGGDAAWSKAWVADHLWQIERDGQPALAWLIAFNRPAVAERVEALLSQRPAFRIARTGGRVVVLRGMGDTLADALATDLGARRPTAVLDAPSAGN